MNMKYLPRDIQRWFLFLMFFCGFLISCNTESKSPHIDQAASDQEFEEIFSLGGAPIQVKVRLSNQKIELTDKLTLTLRIEHSEGVRIVPPYLSEAVYAPLLLVEKPQNDIRWSKDNQFMINQWRYQFEPIGSGDFSLRAFDLYFRLDKERAPNISDWPVYAIRVEPIPYQVVGVEIDPGDDIKDIKGLILPEINFIPLWIAIGSILIMVLCIFALSIYLANKKQQTASLEDTIDYCQIALDALDCLEQKELIQKHALDQLHTELSSILRQYLENYFQIKAQEQTTEEFISDISESKKFTGEWRDMLHQFFQLADLVKFATFEPDNSVSRGAIKNVREFVLKTGKPHGI